MARNKPRAPSTPRIELPTPAKDAAQFGRLGVIAAVGFAVGVAWPVFAGIELVDRPPADDRPRAEGSAAASAVPVGSALAALPVPGFVASAEPASDAAAAPSMGAKVTLSQIAGCRDEHGKRPANCDAPPFDLVFAEPLRALLACDGASSLKGVLSLGFDVDYAAGALKDFVSGKSTSLASSAARTLVDCAERELKKVALDRPKHEFSRYRLFYLVEFGAEPKSPQPAGGEADESGSSSGRATVAWKAAMIRKTPRDGEVIARVLGGTKVTVTGHQGDWYRVKYDAQGNEGWVFREAIGM